MVNIWIERHRLDRIEIAVSKSLAGGQGAARAVRMSPGKPAIRVGQRRLGCRTAPGARCTIPRSDGSRSAKPPPYGLTVPHGYQKQRATARRDADHTRSNSKTAEARSWTFDFSGMPLKSEVHAGRRRSEARHSRVRENPGPGTCGQVWMPLRSAFAGMTLTFETIVGSKPPDLPAPANLAAPANYQGSH